MSCYHPEDGGFGASPRNDSHLLSTLSALQILALLDELDRVDTGGVAACEEPHAQAAYFFKFRQFFFRLIQVSLTNSVDGLKLSAVALDTDVS